MGAFSSDLCWCYHCQKSLKVDYEEGRRSVLKYVDTNKVPSDIHIIRKYITISSGLLIYTCTFIPKNIKPKSMIFFVLGFTTCIDREMNHEIGCILAKEGYIVFMHDIGHGRSDGLWLYIKSFQNTLVKTAYEIHNKAKNLYIRTKHDNEYDTHPNYHVPWDDLTYIDKNNLYFILGNSLGGAITINLVAKYPDAYKSMLLLSPMTGMYVDIYIYSKVCVVWIIDTQTL